MYEEVQKGNKSSNSSQKNSQSSSEQSSFSVQGKVKKANASKPGLPGKLKAGIENLSGKSMDDVTVNYNSSKPASFQALAYAQGTNIYVSPGQEKHLPHEAWHVVQYKQGRVQPTMYRGGIPINNDPKLEREADVMGGKALAIGKYNPDPKQGQELTHVLQSNNGAIQQKPSVQCVSNTGLAAPQNITNFAQLTDTYWQNPTNQNRPITDLTDFLINQINQRQLFPPCHSQYQDEGSSLGFFDPKNWMITINTSKFSKRAGVATIGQLNQHEVADILETLYHETRHAEQQFRIAKIKIGQGRNIADMNIPYAVLLVASNLSTTVDTEAEVWQHYQVSGKYEGYVLAINGGQNHKSLITMYEEIAAISSGQMILNDVVTEVDSIIDQINATIKDYLNPTQSQIDGLLNKDMFDMGVIINIQEIKSAFKDLKKEFARQKTTGINLAILSPVVLEFGVRLGEAYHNIENENDGLQVGKASKEAFIKL